MAMFCASPCLSNSMPFEAAERRGSAMRGCGAKASRRAARSRTEASTLSTRLGEPSPSTPSPPSARGVSLPEPGNGGARKAAASPADARRLSRRPIGSSAGRALLASLLTNFFPAPFCQADALAFGGGGAFPKPLHLPLPPATIGTGGPCFPPPFPTGDPGAAGAAASEATAAAAGVAQASDASASDCLGVPQSSTCSTAMLAGL
mmetsp:Transcript_121196/g.387151  ORF Transcript_121196/g.387151 Transcript_121196/m.387151 type:complete len:205 (+) Transcript_121196:3304-3918(+)